MLHDRNLKKNRNTKNHRAQAKIKCTEECWRGETKAEMKRFGFAAQYVFLVPSLGLVPGIAERCPEQGKP